MVIQCKQCETTYNFDESALHEGAINVRCVRCKAVFTVDSTSSIITQSSQPLPAADPANVTEPTEIAAEIQAKPIPEPEPLPEWESDSDDLSPEWDADSDAFSFSSTDDFSFDNEDDDDEPLFAPSSESTPIADEPTSQHFTFESLDSETEIDEPAPLAPPIAEQAAPSAEKVDETPPPKAKKGKTSKLMVILLLIVLIMACAYGYFYVTLGTTDVRKMIQNIQQQLQQQPLGHSQQGEIRISTTQSYYVDNSNLGQIFIIKGSATNNYATVQSELSVKGTLYQKDGVALAHQTAYCGNILNNEQLQSATKDVLNNQMANPFGAALSNVNVAPGQSLPFMIVFTDLPDELNEFSVEGLTSKAASN